MSESEVILLFNLDDTNKSEFVSATNVWGSKVCLDREQVPENSVVLSRYASLPFYSFFEDVLELKNSTLTHPYSDYEYISEMKWYEDLKRSTPTTWFTLDDVPDNLDSGYIVKGLTYSRKYDWNRSMYAKDFSSLLGVVARLKNDPLLGGSLVFREYVPLKSYGTQQSGLPLTEEWRCFFVGDTLISSGFYWSTYEGAIDYNELPPEGLSVVMEAASTVVGATKSAHIFYTIDVAQTMEGKWIVIELNEGSQAGLSSIDANHFYTKLKEAFYGK